MVNAFPDKFLTYLFPLLDTRDLLTAGCVSTQWNRVQKTDELWRKHCLSFLDNAEPLEGSWKKRFSVINNWMKTLAEKTVLANSFKDWYEYHNFILLEDNTPLEIYRTGESDFTVGNIKNGETHLISIDLQDDKISNATLDGQTWVVLTSKGKIFFYDIPTGQCLKQMAVPIEDSVKLPWEKIKCNENDILVANEKAISVLNAHTGLLEDTIDISKYRVLCDMVSTPNFIICKCRYPDTYYSKVIFIRKKDHQIAETKKVTSDFIASYGSYLAVFYEEGYALRFKDDGEEIVEIHDGVRPYGASSGYSINHFVYKNWLLLSKSKILTVFDIKTGERFSTIPTEEGSLKVCTNGKQLLTRYNAFSLYNFERPTTQLDPQKYKKCSIQ
jgi:hypothetical protein